MRTNTTIDMNKKNNIYIYSCVFACMYMYVCMCVDICVCIGECVCM